MVDITKCLVLILLLHRHALTCQGQLITKGNQSHSHHQIKEGCPDHCICVERINILCQGVDLKGFPEGLPEDTQTLFLKGNKIGSLDNTPYLPNLKWLVLSNNKITDIKIENFNLVLDLGALEMASNQIKIANISVFSNLLNLQFLNLSKNNISTMILSRLPPSMDWIRLDGNLISSVKVDPSFYKNTRHVKINLSHNPINCDCSLISFLQKANATVIGTCRSPDHLFGISLNETDDFSLCEMENTKNNANATGNYEKNIFLLLTVVFTVETMIFL